MILFSNISSFLQKLVPGYITDAEYIGIIVHKNSTSHHNSYNPTSYYKKKTTTMQ